MTVAVIGAGKMGLPLSCQLALRGGEVIVCDVNERLVAAINRGQAPFDEPGVSEILQQVVESGALHASTDVARACQSADVIIVIIPVLLTAAREADLQAIEGVSRTIAAELMPGQMVIYETTLPVGTTRQRLKPILESSGLRAGEDFDLVFSPERVKSQFVLKHLSRVPKIVGGVSPESALRADEFYREHLGAPTINVGTLEAAEFAKLAGMIYRDVNIALANELAAYAESVGVEFTSAAAAANTDGESALLSPSIGVGGHCTPIYPYFVMQDARSHGVPVSITSEARHINDAQARRLLDRVCCGDDVLAGERVLILGLAFRPGVKEHTLSSAFAIREEASRRGATVFLHDPLYDAAEVEALGFSPLELDGPLPPFMVLNTAHLEYRQIGFKSCRERGVRTVIDGRNLWKAAEVRSADLRYIAPGIPEPEPVSRNSSPMHVSEQIEQSESYLDLESQSVGIW